MNTKLLAFVARTGSLMLTIGLVFLVAAMTPAVPAGSGSMHSGNYPGSGRYALNSLSSMALSPQLGIRIQIATDCGLQLYLADWEQFELQNMIEAWMKEHYPSLNATQVWLGAGNASVLEGFLEENPGHILLQDTFQEAFSLDFFPTKRTNVTVILVNPLGGQRGCETSCALASITSIVPRDKTTTPSLALIALGVVFQLASAVSTRFLR
jgi:hypothetical protein